MAAAAFGRAFLFVKADFMTCLAVGMKNVFRFLQFGVCETTIVAADTFKGLAVRHGSNRFGGSGIVVTVMVALTTGNTQIKMNGMFKLDWFFTVDLYGSVRCGEWISSIGQAQTKGRSYTNGTYCDDGFNVSNVYLLCW